VEGRTLERCNVSLNTIDCTGSTHARCFQCGLPACVGCSKVMSYLRYGRVRICNDCQEQNGRDLQRRSEQKRKGARR
jgi:hypothetical protein